MDRPKTDSAIKVDFDIIELAMELVRSGKQNLDYWKTVRVPLNPNRTMPYESLLRSLVFSPLMFVALVHALFGSKFGAVAFAIALPMMLVMHKSLHRDVQAHLTAAAELDAGRYAAVYYLSKKMSIAPAEITWEMVNELARIYAKHWLKVNAEFKAKAAMKAATATRVPRTSHGAGSHADSGFATLVATSFVGVASLAADQDWMMEMPKFNPASGLPMVNDMLDVHGNMYGTTSVDDLTNELYEETYITAYDCDDFATPTFEMDSFGSPGHSFD